MEDNLVLEPKKTEKILRIHRTIGERKNTYSLYGFDQDTTIETMYELAQQFVKIMRGDKISLDVFTAEWDIKYRKFNYDDDLNDDIQDNESFEKTFTLEPNCNCFNYKKLDVNITLQDFYGKNLDGENARVKVYYLGEKDKPLETPVLVLKEGIDEGEDLNPNGKVSVDTEVNEIKFNNSYTGYNVYKIVKEV